ncbi:MAG: hypothetical protein PHI34_10605 [Acidobacteriota bacterium]|nr:hypothetical protein [Acidobacteriota bacterium]
MKKAAIAGILAAAAALAVAANGQDWDGKAKRLEEEFRLAKTSSVYLVVDAGAKTVSLRIRGLTLKTWPVSNIRSWGRPIGIKSLKVEKRTGWSAEDRVNLTPGRKPEKKRKDKKPKDIGDDVLEIDDMPAKYGFILETNARLDIRPRAKGLFNRSAYALGGLGRSIGRSVRLIWSVIKKREFSNIQVTVPTKKTAQEIFWAVPEGTGILFF